MQASVGKSTRTCGSIRTAVCRVYSCQLTQLSGTHGIVKLTDSHLSALRGRSFVSIVLKFLKIARGNLQNGAKNSATALRLALLPGRLLQRTAPNRSCKTDLAILPVTARRARPNLPLALREVTDGHGRINKYRASAADGSFRTPRCRISPGTCQIPDVRI